MSENTITSNADKSSRGVSGVLYAASAVVAALALTVVAAIDVTGAVSRSSGTPSPSCTLQYDIAEDGSWAGHDAIFNGVKIADQWRVADWRLEGTVTADQAGVIGLNVIWTPGYRGIPCELVRMT